MDTERHAHNLRAIGLILLGALLLSLMDGAMKHLLDQGYGVMQMMAVRGWFMVPMMGLWAWKKMPEGSLKTTRPGLHFIRALIGFFAPLFFFTALITMPLADATVIVFGSTFIMTALSVPLFKEYVGPHRWSAVVLGFVGVYIATNPSGDFFNGGAIYAILASLAYALMMLITRGMGTGEGVFKQVFYFTVWATLVATVLSWSAFVAISVVDLGWVFLIGAFSVFGHLCLARAYSLAPVGVVAPFEYSLLVWATLIGFVVWGHIPGLQVIIGAIIIVASGLYLLHREHRLKHNSKAR